MDASIDQQFYFHADAHAIGASLLEPVIRTYATPASVSLTQSGGRDHVAINEFNGDSLFSVGYSSVHVHGRFDAQHDQYRTAVTSTINNLNILDMVTADRIVGQISVIYPKKELGNPSVANVSLIGTHFVNLRLAGVLVQPQFFRDALTSRTEEQGCEGDVADSAVLPTYGSLLQLAKRQQEGIQADRPNLPTWLRKRLTVNDVERDINQRGTVQCPIVEKVSVDCPLTNYGHVVHIPDFGNVFLGEMLLGRSSSHLTMLRVEMGCMAKGTVNVGTVFTNGRPIP